MNQAQQPEALRLADRVERRHTVLAWAEHDAIAAELRRLHAREQELEDLVDMASKEIAKLQALVMQGACHAAKEKQRADSLQELEVQQKREPLTPDALADHCESWLQAGGASNIVDAYEAGYRECERDHIITAQSDYHPDEERDHSDEDAAIAAGKIQTAVQGRVG